MRPIFLRMIFFTSSQEVCLHYRLPAMTILTQRVWSSDPRDAFHYYYYALTLSRKLRVLFSRADRLVGRYIEWETDRQIYG